MEKVSGESKIDHIKVRILPLCGTCWGSYSGDQTTHTSVYVSIRMCVREGVLNRCVLLPH